jgi:hypothetical protein
MTMMIGGSPGRIYSETEASQGIAPSQGERLSVKDASSGGTKEYLFCKVAASQNLITGHVVTIDGSFVVTIAAVATANTAAHQLGVAITPTTSGTASASTLIWVQVFGRTLVRASLSALPNIGLKIGSVAGQVDDDPASSASAAIQGIVLTATSNLAAELCAAILTYPRYGATNDLVD